MSFLDSLENNLKALESQEERDPEKRKRDLEARQAERDEALRVAPHVETLKSGPYTQQLLSAARTTGHRLRTFVDIAWIGTTLRLDARSRRLELRPSAEGIVAVYFLDGQELRTEPLDLAGSPEDLIVSWLEG
ncbi:MAG TPA: hypothetical protein VGK29_12185 [Paludibaculum sp.]|jgi:hypothetical protein